MLNTLAVVLDPYTSIEKGVFFQCKELSQEALGRKARFHDQLKYSNEKCQIIIFFEVENLTNNLSHAPDLTVMSFNFIACL